MTNAISVHGHSIDYDSTAEYGYIHHDGRYERFNVQASVPNMERSDPEKLARKLRADAASQGRRRGRTAGIQLEGSVESQQLEASERTSELFLRMAAALHPE